VGVKPISHEYLPVPVLAIRVSRTDVPTASGNAEFTHTELENYYVTPDEARSGPYAHKLSFSEALQLFIV
jgi:hypothetical protein